MTGGGGFLGGAIVRRLAARGDTVCSFSRCSYPQLDSLGVRQIQGNIADREAVEKAARNMDLVFHVAAKPGIWGAGADFYHTNVTGTRNIIVACRKYGISALVYTSSPSVVFTGADMEGVDESVPYPVKYHAHYPKTKALAERAIRKAAEDGLPAIVLRPHLIWGPGDNHLVPRIIARAGRLVRIGNGKNLVDTTYIDNAADAHILSADRLMEKPELSGKVYFISQGEPVPLWEMINDILKAAGLGPVRRTVSRPAARAIGTVLEAAYALFHIRGEPPMTRFLADELATAHWFDIGAAKKDLGYTPAVSTEEGLRRLQEWLACTDH